MFFYSKFLTAFKKLFTGLGLSPASVGLHLQRGPLFMRAGSQVVRNARPCGQGVPLVPSISLLSKRAERLSFFAFMHGEPHLDDNFDHGILGIGSINEQFEGGGGVHFARELPSEVNPTPPLRNRGGWG